MHEKPSELNPKPEEDRSVRLLDDVASLAVTEPMTHESRMPQIATHVLPEAQTDDNGAEFLFVSQKFGREYVGLLAGDADTDIQITFSQAIREQLSPLLAKLDGLDERGQARMMVDGYRKSMDDLYLTLGWKPKFAGKELDEETMKHIVDVGRGAFGIPVLYTDGRNEELFDEESDSFASTVLMVENGLPPLVVVHRRPSEREQVTIHETSHVIFSLLRMRNLIPSPDGEDLPKPGVKSSFELARDEAVAQMAANQVMGGHPSVITYMKEDGYSEALIAAYRDAFYSFTRERAIQGGMQFSDAILGVMKSTNFEELNSHMLRMSQLANIGS